MLADFGWRDTSSGFLRTYVLLPGEGYWLMGGLEKDITPLHVYICLSVNKVAGSCGPVFYCQVKDTG